MYVYEPGAGFSGPCVKVDPGFEENVTQNWDSDSAVDSQMLFKQENSQVASSTGDTVTSTNHDLDVENVVNPR